MIQRIGRASRKGGDSMFVFFISKWSKIKNLIEIKKRQLKKSKNLSVLAVETRNTQLLNNNYLKALKASFLSQVFNAKSKEDILDSESIPESKADLDNIDNDDLMATFLATDVEDFYKKAKKDKQTSCINK